MARQKLSESEIEENLKTLPDWNTTGEKLTRKYKFNNFAESLDFINRVGEIAERHDHHPDILFGWGYAEIFLTTHDSDGITVSDIAMAKEIEALSN